MKYIIIVVCLHLSSTVALSQNWEFARSFDGAGTSSNPALSIDKDGNSFVLGTFTGNLILDTISIKGDSSRKVFLAKFNTGGRVVWAELIASPINPVVDIINANAICVDNLGDVFITGNYLGSALFFGMSHTTIAASEIFTAKLSSTTGELVWIKTAGGYGVGTYNQNEAFAISADQAGNCILTGRYFKTGTFDSITISSDLPHELFVAKYNSTGDIVWVRSGGGDFGIHTGYSIVIDAVDNIFVAGDFFGHLVIDGKLIDAVDAEQKIFLWKISPAGITVWAEEVGTGGYYGISSGIALDTAGNPCIAGFFRSTIDFGSKQLTYDGATISYALLVSKFDSEGKFQWAVSSEGVDQNTRGNAICSDSKGNFYLGGSFMTKTTFGKTTLLPDNGLSTFLAKLDVNGKFLWTIQARGNGSNECRSVGLLPDNTLNLLGLFSDTILCGSQQMTSLGTKNIFLAHVTNSKERVKSGDDKGAEENCYPIPASNRIHFDRSDAISLTNLQGNFVMTCKDCSELNIEAIIPGVYFLNHQKIVICR
ncbi:MAG: hypothetical protein WCH46_06795 [bacterium]